MTPSARVLLVNNTIEYLPVPVLFLKGHLHQELLSTSRKKVTQPFM